MPSPRWIVSGVAESTSVIEPSPWSVATRSLHAPRVTADSRTRIGTRERPRPRAFVSPGRVGGSGSGMADRLSDAADTGVAASRAGLQAIARHDRAAMRPAPDLSAAVARHDLE